jgi:PAS domain S-box-containing protein
VPEAPFPPLLAEVQFRAAAQALPGHVWTATPAGAADWFNDPLLSYTGRTSDDLLGDKWLSIVHPNDRAGAAQCWKQALGSGAVYDAEFRIQRHDGAWIWHQVRGTPIRDADGAIERWVGSTIDCNQQKLIELAADRDRLWSLSRDLMLVCTFDGVITAINPSATTMLGWSEDEMVGRPLAEFIHPQDVAATAAQVAKLARGTDTLSFENRYRARSGDYHLLAWTAVPAADRIHAVGRDVTAEREVVRDRERIWALSPVLKLVTDRQGIIVDVNPTWTKVLGWTREESVGKRSAEFIVGDDMAWAKQIDRLASGIPLEEYRTVLLARDGANRLIQWTTVPDAGKFYGFGRDITAEVEGAKALGEAEEALRQAQKMEAVGQLTGGIAHDFNNLLQGISGSLDIMRRRIAQNRLGDMDRLITMASDASARAAALTHRLLAFSRRQPLDPKPVAINSLIHSLEDMVRRTLDAGISLRLSLASDLWTAKCDPNQLENALLNLVINARDAMPAGGTLTIATRNVSFEAPLSEQGAKPGRYVGLAVTDTGVGMDAETVRRAFEPFFTTKAMGQGTGLGLSMVYGFARQSEGHAAIDSAPGDGTTFHLYLPYHAAALEPETAPDGPCLTAVAEVGEVVLVVEDEATVRTLVVDQLRELGYHVLQAADGPEGVDILNSSQVINLLLTDIGLPGMNGRLVAQAGRTCRPDLPILFMTGYAETATQAAGFLEPGMGLITKPFEMEMLAQRVRETMTQAPLRAEAPSGPAKAPI